MLGPVRFFICLDCLDIRSGWRYASFGVSIGEEPEDVARTEKRPSLDGRWAVFEDALDYAAQLNLVAEVTDS